MAGCAPLTSVYHVSVSSWRVRVACEDMSMQPHAGLRRLRKSTIGPPSLVLGSVLSTWIVLMEARRGDDEPGLLAYPYPVPYLA
jgi:hypothetical protein